MRYIKINLLIIVNILKAVIPGNIVGIFNHASIENKFKSLENAKQEVVAQWYANILLDPENASETLKAKAQDDYDVLGLCLYVYSQLVNEIEGKVTYTEYKSLCIKCLQTANSEDIDRIMPYVTWYMYNENETKSLFQLLKELHKDLIIGYTNSKESISLNPLILKAVQNSSTKESPVYYINRNALKVDWADLVKTNPLALQVTPLEELKKLLEDDSVIERIESNAEAICTLNNRLRIANMDPFTTLTKLAELITVSEDKPNAKDQVQIFLKRYNAVKSKYPNEIKQVIDGEMKLGQTIEFTQKAPDADKIIAVNLIGFAVLKLNLAVEEESPRKSLELAVEKLTASLNKDALVKLSIYSSSSGILSSIFKQTKTQFREVLGSNIQNAMEEDLLDFFTLYYVPLNKDTISIKSISLFESMLRLKPTRLEFIKKVEGIDDQTLAKLCQTAVDADIRAVQYVPLKIAMSWGDKYKNYVRSLIGKNIKVSNLQYNWIDDIDFTIEVLQYRICEHNPIESFDEARLAELCEAIVNKNITMIEYVPLKIAMSWGDKYKNYVRKLIKEGRVVQDLHYNWMDDTDFTDEMLKAKIMDIDKILTHVHGMTPDKVAITRFYQNEKMRSHINAYMFQKGLFCYNRYFVDANVDNKELQDRLIAEIRYIILSESNFFLQILSTGNATSQQRINNAINAHLSNDIYKFSSPQLTKTLTIFDKYLDESTKAKIKEALNLSNPLNGYDTGEDALNTAKQPGTSSHAPNTIPKSGTSWLVTGLISSTAVYILCIVIFFSLIALRGNNRHSKQSEVDKARRMLNNKTRVQIGNIGRRSKS